MQPSGVALTGFDPAQDTDELVHLWRVSFEHGVGIDDPHPLSEQRAFLLDVVAVEHRVQLLRDGSGILAFLATTPTEIGHLYVRTDRLGQGLGSRLVGLAKAQSSGTLDLHTFARNAPARAFYARHGFVEVAEGFEEHWQLPDVLLRWTADG